MSATATLTAATNVSTERARTRTVADAMITDVKLSGPDATVRDLRTLFQDEHIHAAVIVEGRSLLSVVDRSDVEERNDDDLARNLGCRRSRVVAPDADLEQARQVLLASGRRRLAVVAADYEFRGLLCLKRTRLGFCSDRDVRARSR